MTRDQIAASVGRVVNALDRLGALSKKAQNGSSSKGLEAEMAAAENEAKLAAIEIGIDTLHVLHRIADALEGTIRDVRAISETRERL